MGAPGFDEKIKVAVLGATGSVGQRFIALLDEHSWFDVTTVCASPGKAGQRYGDAVQWVQDTPLPERAAALELSVAEPGNDVRVAFSALDADVAGSIETAFAEAGVLVVSNAKSHRMDADVPLLVPEVNADHMALFPRQSFDPGGILTNPNCSTIGLVLSLAPLVRAFGVNRVHVVTLQARSGAGLAGYDLDLSDNVLPNIEGEADKLVSETRRILGTLSDTGIDDADLTISAQCNRVSVKDGHTECVTVELGREATREEIIEAWNDYSAMPQALELPSAPEHPTIYLEGDAPQPALHRDMENGMATIIGQLAPSENFGWSYKALSHNTVRGAAGGAILVAELAIVQGYLLP